MPAHLCSLYIKLFTLDPMWMLQTLSTGQHRASQSSNLEESPLSVAGPAADNLYFVVLSQSHSYLKFVPLGWWQCTLPGQFTWLYKGSALCRSNEKKSVLVENLWVSCPPILHKVWRDTLSNLTWHFVCFFLPLVLCLPLPLVGIGFSQDQVALLQQNGISLSIIVLLLSLSLSSGLLLHLLEVT